MDIKRLNPLIRERVISNGKAEVKNKIQKPDTEPNLELARKLALRNGIAKYQTYIKSLLHDTLAKEAAGER